MTPGRAVHLVPAPAATGGSDLRPDVDDDGPGARLLGRADVLDDLVARLVGATGGAPGVVVGAVGAGRSALLAAVATEVDRVGLHACLVRGVPGDRAVSYRLLYRVVSSLIIAGRRPEPAALRLLTAIAGAESNQHAAERIAGALATVLRHKPTALLVDDAHHTDPASLRVLVLLARLLGDRPGGVVLALLPDSGRLPAAAGVPGWTGVLGGLGRDDVELLIRSMVRADPDPQLVDALLDAAHGNPGVTIELVDTLLRAGRIIRVDSHAHLLPGQPLLLGPTSATVASVRAVGAAAWRVAKAIAVLGSADTEFLSSLGDDPAWPGSADTGELCRQLERAELITWDVEAGGWRFRVPAVAAAVRVAAGPYERQAMAVAALTRSRRGDLDLADRRRTAQLLVGAEHVIPAADRPAASELLLTLARQESADRELAGRWRGVGLALRGDSATAVRDTVEHVLCCARRSRWDEVVAATGRILRVGADRLPAGSLSELLIAWTEALDFLGRQRELAVLAERDHRTLPISPALRSLARCAALVRLRRWSAADTALTESEPEFAASPDLRATADQLRATVDVATGRRMSDGHHRRPTGPDQARRGAVLLCATGDLVGATDLLAGHGLDRDALAGPSAVLAAYLAGDWSVATRLARTLHAARAAAVGPTPGSVYACAAAIHAARGRFGVARRWLSHAASAGVAGDDPCLTLATARIAQTMGDLDTARELLHGLVDGGERQADLTNVDEALSTLLMIEFGAGRPAEARALLDRLDHVAGATGTGRARLLWLSGKSVVTGDPAAAAAAVDLAHARRQPFETAVIYWHAAQVGPHTDRFLDTAYDLFGRLEALVWRARVRAALRVAGSSRPRQRAAVTENDRLMTLLVTDGLSNRELSGVMNTTAKSVEGQLARMFARSGLRSRMELLAATRTAENTLLAVS